MKNLIILTILLASIQISNAQEKSTDAKANDLKGHLKHVVLYTFKNKISQNNLDTAVGTQDEINTFDFNSEGFYTKRVSYIKDGNFTTTNIYHYINDTLTTEDQYDSRGKLESTYSSRYDSKHQLKEYDMPFPHMKTNKGIIFLYQHNNKGKVVKIDQYNSLSNNLMEVDSMIYSNAPQVIEYHEYKYSPPPTFEKIIRYFDANDRVIKSETFDQLGKLIDQEISSYKNFDKNGNWLLEVIEKHGESKWEGKYSYKRIIKRFISYY